MNDVNINGCEVSQDLRQRDNQTHARDVVVNSYMRSMTCRKLLSRVGDLQVVKPRRLRWPRRWCEVLAVRSVVYAAHT